MSEAQAPKFINMQGSIVAVPGLDGTLIHVLPWRLRALRPDDGTYIVEGEHYAQFRHPIGPLSPFRDADPVVEQSAPVQSPPTPVPAPAGDVADDVPGTAVDAPPPAVDLESAAPPVESESAPNVEESAAGIADDIEIVESAPTPPVKPVTAIPPVKNPAFFKQQKKNRKHK